jgi:hypothetical protein
MTCVVLATCQEAAHRQRAMTCTLQKTIMAMCQKCDKVTRQTIANKKQKQKIRLKQPHQIDSPFTYRDKCGCVVILETRHAFVLIKSPLIKLFLDLKHCFLAASKSQNAFNFEPAIVVHRSTEQGKMFWYIEA